MGLVFQYMVEFPPFANPPKRKGEFVESLRQFFEGADFDYAMGALGGNRRTYGFVGRYGADALPADREALRDWLEKQPIKAVARIGKLEPNSPEMDLLGVISDVVFSVDNLSDSDRSEAAAYAERITELIRRQAKRTADGDQ